VDIDICGLVCDVTRLHVAELSVELLEAMLLLLKDSLHLPLFFLPSSSSLPRWLHNVPYTRLDLAL
jgi:hypothetical protein